MSGSADLGHLEGVESNGTTMSAFDDVRSFEVFYDRRVRGRSLCVVERSRLASGDGETRLGKKRVN